MKKWTADEEFILKEDLPTKLSWTFTNLYKMAINLDPEDKKCHVWIKGDADLGKTTCLQTWTDKYKIIKNNKKDNFINYNEEM